METLPVSHEIQSGPLIFQTADGTLAGIGYNTQVLLGPVLVSDFNNGLGLKDGEYTHHRGK